MVRLDPVQERDKGGVPLYRRFAEDGSWVHMTVPMMRKLVRDRMARLGYECVKEWGAHSCRI